MSTEESIFDEALTRSAPAERAAFLERACAGDPQLRAAVEALLRAHERARGILESPPPTFDAAAPPPAPSEDVGAAVGRYKLLERIGEGGMGVVYMAEQAHPVRRRVALKIIKPGLDTAQVIARFEAERQALALMDHPSIAKVLDAGATDAGRPYFVMELVRGVPITEYCDQHHLSPRQRLELFVHVCQAVQHAHTKGIIHRDLKPTNVLVTVADDGRPVPKVIDFGVSKAMAGQRLTDRTLFTEFRQLVGTPLYMSPEQAEMSAVTDVDTRSDVYSLGVLLYELLTGTTPFDKQRLAKATYDEVRRIIREEEPPRPSTRLSTLGETPASVSAQRQTDPKKLSQTVRGELDWIVMRALEKERTRRYETALGLARDVERYLADEPVLACPPSRMYRLRKFARRNKALMATAGVVTIVLIAATAVSSWQAVQATRAKLEARRETEKQEAVNQFLNDMLGSGSTLDRTVSDPHRGPDVTMREVVANAAREIEAGSLKGRPEIEAAVRRTLALVFANMQQTEKARAYMRTALDLNRQVYGLDHPATADCMIRLGYWTGGAKGEGMMRDGLAVQRKHLGDDNITVVNSMCLLAGVLRDMRKSPESEAISRQALAIREKLPANLLPPLSAPLYNLARSLSAQKRYAEAEPLIRRAVEIQRQVRGENVGVRGERSSQPSYMWWHLLEVLANQGKPEAEPMLREVLASDPANVDAASRLAEVLRAQLKTSEADRVTRDLVTALRAEPDPAARIGRPGLWRAAKLAGTLAEHGELADAEWLYRVVVVAYRKNNGDVWNTAQIAGWLSDVLYAQDKRDEAEQTLREYTPVFRAAVDAQRKKEGETSHFATVMTACGARLEMAGHLSEAEQLFREGLAIRRKLLAEEAPEISWSLNRLSAVLKTQGKTDELRTLWQERLNHWDKELAKADTDERRAVVLLRRYPSLVKLGEIEQAKATCWKALEAKPSSPAAAGTCNEFAWIMATSPVAADRDTALAVALGERAVAILPEDGSSWNTLGVAHYRAGDDLRAVAALNRSIELRKGGDSFDWFFLAMAHHRLGSVDAARQWYDKAVQWMDQKAAQDEELRRFQAEAASLLGLPIPPPATAPTSRPH